MTFLSFVKSYGMSTEPQAVACDQGTRLGLTYQDGSGNQVWLNQSKTNATKHTLTLVDFTMAPTEENRLKFLQQFSQNLEKLSVVVSHKETAPGIYDGEEVYTLVDTDKLNGSGTIMAGLKDTIMAKVGAQPAQNGNVPF